MLPSQDRGSRILSTRGGRSHDLLRVAQEDFRAAVRGDLQPDEPVPAGPPPPLEVIVNWRDLVARRTSP
jgi:hypothetical protein